MEIVAEVRRAAGEEVECYPDDYCIKVIGDFDIQDTARQSVMPVKEARKAGLFP